MSSHFRRVSSDDASDVYEAATSRLKSAKENIGNWPISYYFAINCTEVVPCGVIFVETKYADIFGVPFISEG